MQPPLDDGSQLNQYKIIRQLGKGGFGITYLALDKSLNKPVALKEYFPDALSFRASEQMHVSVLSADKQSDFTEGLRRFEREAMMLSEFKHPNIIQVLALFKENNTAYFAMDYIEGLSLGDYQKEKNRALTEQEIIKQCLPVLNGLKEVHNKDMLHLDIKPDNIIQTKYGQPILIDFGGARVQTSKKSQVLSQHSSMVATEGYAPTEQYSLIAEQTPATDLYAFGMTLYKLMAPEQVLPKSNDRKDQVFDDLPDPLKPIRQVALGYSDELYQAVEACTQLKQKDRPQTVAQLQRILKPLYSNTPPPQKTMPYTEQVKAKETQANPTPSKPTKSAKNLLIGGLLISLLGGGYFYNEQQKENKATEEKQIQLDAQSVAEAKRLAEEKRIAEQKKTAEAKRLAEQERIAEQQKAAEAERLAEQERIAEQKKTAEAERLAEQERIAEQQKMAEAERLAEQERIAEQQKMAEAERLAEQKRLQKAEAKANQLPPAPKNISIAASSAPEQQQKYNTQQAYAEQFPELLKKGLVPAKGGLMWMRCSFGQAWTGTTCEGKADEEYSWEEAITFAKSQKYLGFSDWRLPTLQELDSLVYCSKGRDAIVIDNEGKYVGKTIEELELGFCLKDDYQRPTLNQILFPNTGSGFYWSSSPDAFFSNNAWGVFFNAGSDFTSNRNDFSRVRLVRSGQ